MTKMIIMFISLNFSLACLAFTLNNKHLLSTLLSLEFIMLNLFMCIFIYLNNNKYEMYLLMSLLTMMVCEGALGLAILVSMVRTHGNEFFQSFNIMC